MHNSFLGWLRKIHSSIEALDERLKRVRASLLLLRVEIKTLAIRQERAKDEIMATITDLKDALAEQNQAILDEIDEINKKMDELKQDPAKLDEVVTDIKANTAAIKGIIEEPLPEPVP